ncbi:serine/threonine-protein kinase [Nonomuraea sp. NPDC050790]|uniref:serine/threonine-protein kinase n=1 Tax=Nonomuraea sp. NPDC050790 TaxID=3364371 RepID=UPI0037A3EEDD
MQSLRPDDPQAIGAYRLTGRLGEGGQGVVYLGQAPDGTKVAVKVLREGGDGLAREVAALRRVEPFCVAQVLDASTGGRPYIVTEYVEGPSLAEAGRHGGAGLQRLAVATATALAAIHRAGVVHRDFKPGNVLLGRDGPRVIDFGIARSGASLTLTSSIVGTPAYMAPEQLAGHQVGPATDVFAWAGVMVFAATGRPPFGNDSLPAVITRIQHAAPDLGGLTGPLLPIVTRCLAKDPAARPTMQEVLFQLIGAVAPPEARVRHGAPERKPPSSRRALLVAGAAAGSVVVTAGLVTALVTGISWPVAETPLSLPSTETPGGTPTKAKPTRFTAGKTGRPSRSPTPRPTATPSRTGESEDAKPTPANKPTTNQPTTTRPTTKPTTSAPSGRVGSVSLRSEGLRTGDCYRQSNIAATVGASRKTPFTYRWILDGRDMGKAAATAPTKLVLGYAHIQSDGPHTVQFRVLSPNAMTRTFSFSTCDGAPWPEE